MLKVVSDRVENGWSSPHHEMYSPADRLDIRHVFGRNKVFLLSGFLGTRLAYFHWSSSRNRAFHSKTLQDCFSVGWLAETESSGRPITLDLKSEHDLCRSEVFHFKTFAKLPLGRGDFGLAASIDKEVIDVKGDDQDARRLVTDVEAGVSRTACDF